ncbi:Topless-related protein 1 [Platanthera zijinensis]|uniref:Topless-related protein 1 n=1 Tax=Platanthera zijinensis TaxID=2320716 RepID=A0AAP0AY82_9ASPA
MFILSSSLTYLSSSYGCSVANTTKSNFLAVGDEFMIKFWDMENADILTTHDVQVVLPAHLRLCFNRLGSLLAVSTNDNCVRILGSAEGFDLLHETDIQLSRNS